MPPKTRNKNLAFFLTCGLSLKKWSETGLLVREIALYNLLASQFQKIYFFTYGANQELAFQKYLASNIEIIFKNSRLPDFLYSLLIPLYHRHILKSCSFFKSNQANGAWSAYLSKLMSNRGGKFVFRTGFTWSLFARQENKILRFFTVIIEAWLYRVCDSALVSSAADKAYLQKQYHLSSAKLMVLANYVDTDLFKPQPHVPKLAKSIVYVGRLHPQKNLFNLVRALQCTNLKLDIIGQGKLKDKLEKFARSLNVSIQFLGIIPHQNLPNLLNRYKIYVLPSLYEGLPKTLIEAMACGLACLGANIPGIKEVIQHNVNGYLVNPNIKSMRKGIQNLVQDDRLRNRLGNEARQTIEKRFNLKNIAKQEIKIYEFLFK